MQFLKMFSFMAVGISLGLVSTVAAAAPATVLTNVNVRNGPGINYPVVDILTRGNLVEVDRCDYGWCFVRYDHHGWIAEELLQKAYAPQRYGFPRNAPTHVGKSHGYHSNDMAPRLYGHDAQRYGVKSDVAW